MKIKITHELLNGLRQKAEAATPGPWKVKIIQAGHSPGGWLRTCSWVLQNDQSDLPYTDDNGVKNHTYMAAANPAVVLALIEEIEQLRSIKNELVEELSCVLQHTDLSGWSLGEQIEKSATDLLRKISKTS
jgi:hypothetical protein